MDASVNRIIPSLDERALLVALRLNGAPAEEIEYSLEELKMLVITAGGVVVDSIVIRRDALDPSTIVGKGQLERILLMAGTARAKLVVFDLNNIKPAQVRNLEEYLKCRVIGRTEVILDIFAKRARSSESKIQVELAQLNYLLPRLKGLGGVLSRLGGGIGTRGPGEKMLETDRRHILRRIHVLKDKLKRIDRHRDVTRKARSGEFRGAVVGYTNAGKSTLVNILAKDDLFVENRLFATLDSYTRSVYLENGKHVLLSDTIGFIRNLPSHLIQSFKSTLQEIKDADFIIHVIDINSFDVQADMRTVEAELEALECVHKPSMLFFSKCDLVTQEERIQVFAHRYPHSIFGSSLTGSGISELKKRICSML
jgi:GTP-binding protein HflX